MATQANAFMPAGKYFVTRPLTLLQTLSGVAHIQQTGSQAILFRSRVRSIDFFFTETAFLCILIVLPLLASVAQVIGIHMARAAKLGFARKIGTSITKLSLVLNGLLRQSLAIQTLFLDIHCIHVALLANERLIAFGALTD